MKKQALCLLLSICLLIGVLAIGLPTLAGEGTPTYYSISAAREGEIYYVTVRCNWSDFTMLNGEFLFTYDTEEWELQLEDRAHGPIDPANSLTPLPAAEVGVNTTAGEVRLAFISTDGAEFVDGWVTMLVLPFKARNPETEDIKIEMSTDTLVAAGDSAGEKVDVLEENNDVPTKVEFEKPVAEVPTTVITTTTTTTTTRNPGISTVPPEGEPVVGADKYNFEVFVADNKATVTITCDYRDFYMLNGEFVFTYPTDRLDLILGKKVGPKDPANEMSDLPGKQVKVDEETGTIRVGFMSGDGSAFLDGPVTILKMEFDIVGGYGGIARLDMACDTLMQWDENDPRGTSVLDLGLMPRELRWFISMYPSPTTEPTTAPTTAPQGPAGDVDGNSEINSTDARLTLQYSVKKITADKLNLLLADVDGNGEVNSTDARLILQYAVKKITKFPVSA